MNKFKSIIKIIKREVGWISSDLDLAAMLIAAPLFYSFFYGTMYMNKIETEVPIAVYDEDRSNDSYQFVNDLNANALINVKVILNNPDEMKEKLINEEVQGVIYIPKNFSSDLKYNRSVTVKTFLITHRFLHSNDLNKAINEVALHKGEQIRIQYFNSKSFSYEQAKELSTPLKDDTRMLFNPSESYGDFLIPAILVLVLQQTLFMGLGQSMAKENQTKKFIELKNLSANNSLITIAGKIIFYLTLYFAYSILFFSIHLSVFKIEFKGSYLAFLLMSVLLIISISSLALIIGSFFSKKVHALILISFTTFPLFFFTGYSWPKFALPLVAQIIGYLIPTTPYLQSLNRVVLMGAELKHILPEFLHILFLTITYFLLAVRFIQRKYFREEITF
ncbi:ABC transporter permease [Ignavibacterium sp.]|uniref:ABC transporter permease n=1 Tax=Ignavibacterium sp. TaxID=2651167 RepID=UPI00307F5A5E